MSKEFFKKIREKWQTIFAVSFVTVAISFSVSVFIPAKYSSEIKMIIIQNHESDKVDAYSAAKSAEYLSNIISNVIYTESFIDKVFDSPFELKDSLPVSAEKKEKAWKKMINFNKESNTGILTITALDKSQEESGKIAESIAWALNVHGSEYHGGGDSVQIRLIDGPITSDKPTTPNILMNVLLALIVGLLSSGAIIYFFDDFELVLFSGRRNEIDTDEIITNEMSVKLEKIRENLKKQKATSFVSDDYQIELDNSKEVSLKKPRNDSEAEARIQDISDDFAKNIEEHSAIVNQEIISKKAEAPKNIPIFKEEEKEEKL